MMVENNPDMNEAALQEIVDNYTIEGSPAVGGKAGPAAGTTLIKTHRRVWCIEKKGVWHEQ